MIGVTGRLALCVYGADRALLYTYDWCHGSPGTLCTGLIGHYFILMIGVTGRLALRVYGADRALLYTNDWCHGSPGTSCVRG